MPVEQGLPWHPAATGLAGQAIPFVDPASHAHALPSPPFWSPVPAVLVASPAWLCPSSLSAVLALVPRGVAPAFCVSVLLLPLSVGALGCPFRAPGISHFCTTWTVPCAVGWSQPCFHPRGGHLPARGALVEYVRTLEREGGRCLLMARSRAPHLVVAAVLAPHGSLVYCCVSYWGSSHCCVWGGSVPSCFAACVPPNFGLFLLLLARFALLVRGVRGAACRSLPPIVAVGLSHFQLGGTGGTGHFCTCLQIYKLTCHWCVLGLFWGECDVLLLFCILGC